MKRAKKKPAVDKVSSFEKPVLRSEAFARARSKAKLRMVGPGGLRSLCQEAAKKAASLPRNRFKDNWPYLQTMLRLVGAHERREYRQASNDALLWVVTALNYLIDPLDLIPDMAPFLGLVDDAIVVAHVVGKTRKTLDEFMIWETAGVARLR
jgi:uncharacterized membrane protein YkvA (DUF1232 family)